MSSHFLLLSIWLLFTNYNNNFVQVQEYYMAQNLRENKINLRIIIRWIASF